MKAYIALTRQDGDISILGTQHRIALPKGCLGFLLIFRHKQDARKCFGKGVSLAEITMSDMKPNNSKGLQPQRTRMPQDRRSMSG
jgi:hypothetical protein